MRLIREQDFLRENGDGGEDLVDIKVLVRQGSITLAVVRRLVLWKLDV